MNKNTKKIRDYMPLTILAKNVPPLMFHRVLKGIVK